MSKNLNDICVQIMENIYYEKNIIFSLDDIFSNIFIFLPKEDILNLLYVDKFLFTKLNSKFYKNLYINNIMKGYNFDINRINCDQKDIHYIVDYDTVLPTINKSNICKLNHDNIGKRLLKFLNINKLKKVFLKNGDNNKKTTVTFLKDDYSQVIYKIDIDYSEEEDESWDDGYVVNTETTIIFNMNVVDKDNKSIALINLNYISDSWDVRRNDFTVNTKDINMVCAIMCIHKVNDYVTTAMNEYIDNDENEALYNNSNTYYDGSYDSESGSYDSESDSYD
jgi:hypothetical protein